jgi:Ser/Thr protein kinase RdoA (MazF antagonist)
MMGVSHASVRPGCPRAGGRVLLIDLVVRAAKHARRDPAVLAWALAYYEHRHHLDAATLASWLDLAPTALASLALCRRPDPQLACFWQDVNKLAAVSGCNGRHLSELLLEVEGDLARRGLPASG